jgi:hypothetical protein
VRARSAVRRFPKGDEEPFHDRQGTGEHRFVGTAEGGDGVGQGRGAGAVVAVQQVQGRRGGREADCPQVMRRGAALDQAELRRARRTATASGR